MFLAGGVGSQISASGIDLATARAGLGGGRIEWISATQIALIGVAGPGVSVNGSMIEASAVALLVPGDNLITASGADAGAAMAASTLYYVYLSNAAATFSPGRMRASLTAPTRVSGIYALGAAGNAANWLFLGWVRTTSATQFADSQSDRAVVNYYNRVWRSLFVCPSYNDDDADTTYVVTTAAWGAIVAGASVSTIYNGEDSIRLAACFCKSAGAVGSQWGIGRSATTPDVSSAIASALTSTSIGCSIEYGGSNDPLIGATPIAVTFSMLGFTSGVGVTLIADRARNGAVADPPSTWLEGRVAC